MKMNWNNLLRKVWLYPGLIVILFAGVLGMAPPPYASGSIRFAVIGDYGRAGSSELDVANLVKSWDPDFIITTGDNNYPDGSAATIDQNIGQYYHEFIFPYTGAYGAGAATNRFFPSLGNHDWVAPDAQPYLDYFTLPGNERYYDFIRGPVHFFVVDSDSYEPSGITSTSIQAAWLQNALAASTSPWNLVYLHHAPYSSGEHGSNTTLQWPYAAWGADAVLAGHDHTYERIFRDGIVYFVNGLGGRSIYSFGAPVTGSQFRYNEDYGAMLVDATGTQVSFEFINRTGEIIDSHVLDSGPTIPSVPVLSAPANNALTADYTPLLNWNDSTPNLDHYQIQLATDSAFTAIVLDQNDIALSEFTPLADLAPNTKYYWRVRAYNAVGDSSAWSASRTFRTAILPPTLTAPTDGGFLLNKRPTFTWEAVPGAASYVLEVSTLDTFASKTINKTVPALSYTHTADLLPSTHYFWRVKANAAAGSNGPSAYSDVWEFTTANPPSIPVLSSPANNALTTDYTPLLDWKDSTLPSGTTFGHYEVQVDNNSDFSSPEATGSTASGLITDSQFTPTSDLASNTKFYWRVRSLNDAGEYSAWSASRTFRTALTPPVLNTPANEADLLELRPPFDWSDVPGATGYTIQIANNPNFKPVLRTSSTVASTYIPTADLTKNATLYWRVQTRGANGPSEWSAHRTFHTPINPPAAPTLTAPANNFLTTDYTPTFTWSMPLTSPPFDHFIVQVDNNADFSSPEVNETDVPASPFTPTSDLASNTKFYWRVRAVNATGEMGNWSASRTFRTALTPPVLTAPANGSTATDTTPTFTWSAVPGASSYTLQVSKNDTFTQLVLNKTVTTAAYTPTTALPANIPLFWRVKANGVNGPSLWSNPVWTLTISQ